MFSFLACPALRLRILFYGFALLFGLTLLVPLGGFLSLLRAIRATIDLRIGWNRPRETEE